MPQLLDPRPALSTMWAVQPRFEHDLASFVSVAADLGFGGIELNHSMGARQIEVLVRAARAAGLEVRSLHAPAPWALIEDGPLHGRENRTLNLASVDEAERTLAVAQHLASIEVAARHSISAVVVHLGGIGVLDATLDTEDWLRARYLDAFRADHPTDEGSPPPASPVGAQGLAPPPSSDRGEPPSVRGEPPSVRGEPPSVRGEPPSVRREPSSVRREPVEPPRRPPEPRPSALAALRASEAWQAHLDLARRDRASLAGPWFEAARRSLAELAARAADLGVTLGLESRLRWHEFPLPEEATSLLADHAPEVAGYWHDVGHAEVLARLDLVPLEAWRTLLATRLVGLHIHDVDGLTDHRAPGHAPPTTTIDFPALASMVGDTNAIRTWEVDQREPLGLPVPAATGET